MSQARGVLPHRHDKVMTNPTAQGAVAFVSLRSDLTVDQAAAWLERVQTAITSLRDEVAPDGSRIATVATGFGPSFFTLNGTERFTGLPAPAGFAALPAVPFGQPVPGDVAFYVMSTSEGVTARFLHALWETRPDVIAITVERGYQRIDHTEPFGYRDGVRNIPRQDRTKVVYVDADRHAEEPAYAVGGTYLAYMRVTQNLDAFAQTPPDAQDRIVGRDRAGRRLDLPAGTDPHAEPPIGSDQVAPNSHVRKTGPRGDGNDTVAIFRRGLPFCEFTSAGTLVAGLQFMSFQASLDQFDVVLNRWMLNQNFPTPGTGPDALLAHGLMTIDKHGFFFVPPETGGSIGATLFRPASKSGKTTTGRVAVRKRLTDTNGSPSLLDLHGFAFQLSNADGTAAGSLFTTDAAGHALSEELPAGEYTLTELPPPAPMASAPPQQVSLHSARTVVQVTNTVPPGTTAYGA